VPLSVPAYLATILGHAAGRMSRTLPRGRAEQLGCLRGQARSTVPWQRPAPAAMHRLDRLIEADYTDLFMIAPVDGHMKSPEQWARAILEGAPWSLLVIVGLAWRVLGLRLGPRASPDYILGFKIADRGKDHIIFGTTSWMMTPHLVLKVEGDRVLVATLIRYERRSARCIWPPLSMIHRRVGIALTRHALGA